MKLTFYCDYCPQNFPNVKLLFDHYEREHANRGFHTYEIRHRPSGEIGMASAPSAQEACERVGWSIGDCSVKLMEDN